MRLNYHHLYYFWAVARSGHLTRAAESLHISQSALSGQIRKLEESLGHDLFVREGRRLKLSEAGRVAFTYAEDIFRQGAELQALFSTGHQANREVLKVGAVATLSRNFQEGFIRPLLGRQDLELKLQSGSLEDLLRRLSAHRLDLILSNQPVQGDDENPWRCRRIARQPVSIIGPPDIGEPGAFPDMLRGRPLILPGPDNNIRQAFDQLCDHHQIHPIVLAEVDDMAMMRLLTRDSGHVAVLPPVVVRDELKNGSLKDYGALPGVFEEFYAIRIRRQFESPALKELMTQPAEQLLTFPDN
ncbi:LysR family transcriptional regulator [Marinobacter halophilus]|uniref:LysR family transcriptional regulator n=1 Tax=Marinobacter halophilus TaxID=1323740 RepID=A0A2T1K921_9GAMM|nr:LysR family transcriptional regulator [Marinobacter halophilus]PSF06273.1 LysR family transcriptional regulator [Marinobacter halophilus]GGC71196.1 LysR family transcriptional regulator [Marinobacter halophilus]